MTVIVSYKNNHKQVLKFKEKVGMAVAKSTKTRVVVMEN